MCLIDTQNGFEFSLQNLLTWILVHTYLLDREKLPETCVLTTNILRLVCPVFIL